MPPGNAAKRQKVLIGFVRSGCFGVLIRGLEALESPLKGFNGCGAKMRLQCAVSRLAEPRSSLKKVLMVAVRRCSCGALLRGWQNLEASCERERVYSFRVYEKNQKYTRGLRTSGLRGAIQSSAGSDFAENSGGTYRNRFCPQNAGVKALNRCERVTTVQTQDLCFSKKSCFTASLQ